MIFFALLTGGGMGREKAVMSRTVIFFFLSQTIKLLYYLNVPMLTCLLLNDNVELIMIYSGLCSSFIKIPGYPKDTCKDADVSFRKLFLHRKLDVHV